MGVLLATYFCLFVVTVFIIYQKLSNKYCSSKKRLVGKTCIVTGGTSGMGLEIAKDFARRGARVIIACPFENEGLNAQKLIMEETGNELVIFKHLDFASLDSTRQFAQDIIKAEDRLDILINNAGIGSIENKYSKDGELLTMQVNYFGHFLLTILLLPLLKKSGTTEDKARIVNTSSVLHYYAKYDPGNLNNKSLTMSEMYPLSKLCLVMFTYTLAQKLKGENVVVYSVDPGCVGTPIFLVFGKVMAFFIRVFFKLFFKTAWDGCQTVLYVALDDNLGDLSGKYFSNCTLSKPKAECYDSSLTGQLWNETAQVVKLQNWEIDECMK